MRVLWTHNFDPAIPEAGIFMHTFADAVRDYGVEVDTVYLGKVRSISSFIVAKKMISAQCGDFDLLHSQYGSMCGVVSAGFPVPSVLSLRGSDWHVYNGSNFKLKCHSKVATTLTKFSLPQYDGIVTVSNRILEEVGKYIGPKNKAVSVIPDPIDTGRFNADSVQTNKKCMDRNFDGGSERNGPRVLFTTVSRRNPIKRLELACESIEICKQWFPDIELVVASNIPVEDMPGLAATCDLAICTSTHEGWPNSIKEALALNIPFVSTDVSDLKDFCRKYPVCKIAEANAIDIASKIKEVLSAKARYSFSSAINEMSLEMSAVKLVGLYEGVLRGSR